MRDNTVKTDGVEVYTDKIYELVDEYIDNLSGDPDEIKSLMRKPPIFKGMLKHIYLNIFKPDENTKTYNNIKHNSNIDYGDIDLLNNLWDIYTGLCYKYLQCPTILNFSLFTGISVDCFNDWNNGNQRAGSDGASSAHRQSYKKWLKECESAAYDSALAGNPGAMFILKANYGYTEQPQKIEFVGPGIPHEQPQEIVARRMQEIPERPKG